MCNLDCLMMKIDRVFPDKNNKSHEPYGPAMQTAETCPVLVSGQLDNSFSDNNQAADQQPRNIFFR